MSCVQLAEGGFPGGSPPWLVVPVLQSGQSPWIWLAYKINNLHLHFAAENCGRARPPMAMHRCSWWPHTSNAPSPLLVRSLVLARSPAGDVTGRA